VRYLLRARYLSRTTSGPRIWSTTFFLYCSSPCRSAAVQLRLRTFDLRAGYNVTRRLEAISRIPIHERDQPTRLPTLLQQTGVYFPGAWRYYRARRCAGTARLRTAVLPTTRFCGCVADYAQLFSDIVFSCVPLDLCPSRRRHLPFCRSPSAHH